MKTFNNKKDILIHLCVYRTFYLAEKIRHLQRKNKTTYDIPFYKEKEIYELNLRKLKEYFIKLTILNYLLNNKETLKKFEKGEKYEL